MQGGPFASALKRQLLHAGAERASATHWLSVLDGLSRRGVTQHEIDWTGVRPWLAQQVGPVTLADLVAQVEARTPQIQPVLLGGRLGADGAFAHMTAEDVRVEERGEWFAGFLGDDWVADAPSYDEAHQIALEALSESRATAPLYQRDAIAGGDHYQEVLLTLPLRNGLSASQTAELARLRQRTELLDARERQQLAELDLAQSHAGIDDQAFVGSHFPEHPNVLLHLRTVESVDEEGRPTLVVIEVQSDWIKAGQRKGFAGEFDRRWQITPARTDDAGDGFTVTDEAGRVLVPFAATALEARAAAIAAADRGGVARTPPAPAAKSWHLLAMKWAIHHAVELGIPRVAWLSGDALVAGLNVERTVTRMRGRPAGNAGWLISAEFSVGPTLTQEIADNRLPAVLGNALATRVRTECRASTELQELKNIDPIGGEGLRRFYDQVLVTTMRHYLKPFDSAVEAVQVENGMEDAGFAERRGSEVHLHGQPVLRFTSPALAEERTQLINGPLRAHGFAITPALAQVARAGQAMFRRTPQEQAGSTARRLHGLGQRVAALVRAFTRGSVAVDDLGMPLLVTGEPAPSVGGLPLRFTSPGPDSDDVDSPAAFIRLERPFASDPHSSTVGVDALTAAVGAAPVGSMLERIGAAAEQRVLQVAEVLGDPEVVAHLRSEGYDGAIFAGPGGPTFAVFDPDQHLPTPKTPGDLDPEAIYRLRGTEALDDIGRPLRLRPVNVGGLIAYVETGEAGPAVALSIRNAVTQVPAAEFRLPQWEALRRLSAADGYDGARIEHGDITAWVPFSAEQVVAYPGGLDSMSGSQWASVQNAAAEALEMCGPGPLSSDALGVIARVLQIPPADRDGMEARPSLAAVSPLTVYHRLITDLGGVRGANQVLRSVGASPPPDTWKAALSDHAVLNGRSQGLPVLQRAVQGSGPIGGVECTATDSVGGEALICVANHPLVVDLRGDQGDREVVDAVLSATGSASSSPRDSNALRQVLLGHGFDAVLIRRNGSVEQAVGLAAGVLLPIAAVSMTSRAAELIENTKKTPAQFRRIEAMDVPQTLYHGSPPSVSRLSVTATADGGLHFGTADQARARAGDGATLHAHRLLLQRPQRRTDTGGGWRERIQSAKRAGFDSIVYLNRHEGISPEQVKSAIGNTGQFSESHRFLARLTSGKTADHDDFTIDELRAALGDVFGASGIARLEADGLLRLVPTRDHLPLPLLQAGAKRQSGGYHPQQARIYLVAGEIASPEEARKTLLHELGEHYALPRVLGARSYAHLQDRVRRQRKTDHAIAEAWWHTVQHYRHLEPGSSEFVSEVIARTAESSDLMSRPWWARALAAVKRTLFKLGLWVGDLTARDLGDFVVSSARAAMRGEVHRRPQAGAVLARLTGEQAGVVPQETPVPARPASPALQAWFGKSVVANADGSPLRVYHTSTADFDAFRVGAGGLGNHFGTAEQARDRFELKIESNPYGPHHGLQHQTLPVYLKIEKPLRLRDVGSWSAEQVRAALPAEFTAAERASAKTIAQVRALIRAHGYDGVVYQNTGEMNRGWEYRAESNKAFRALKAANPDKRFYGVWDVAERQTPEYQAWSKAQERYRGARETAGVDSWIAFGPSQVKSALGNNGDFSPRDKRIQFRRSATQTETFLRWFSDSKVVAADRSPLIVYHGSPVVENIRAFDPALTGRGTDSLGSGFYFTSSLEAANLYADGQLDGARGDLLREVVARSTAGIVPVYLAIRKPIMVTDGSMANCSVSLSRRQAEAIIRAAPGVRDPETSPISNWMPVDHGVTDAMIREVSRSYIGGNLVALENDFFRGQSTAFRAAVHAATGHDGVISRSADRQRDVYVAWFPEQIKSAIGNSGAFDPGQPDIAFRRSGDNGWALRAAEISRIVHPLVETLPAEMSVHVVTDPDDPAIPAADRYLMARSLGDQAAATEAPSAARVESRIYLFASQITTPASAWQAVLHEVAHVRLHGRFGPELDRILDEIAEHFPAEVGRYAAMYGLDVADIDKRREAAEEVLAAMAEADPQLSWVRAAVAAIRTFLRRLARQAGLDIRMTRDEVIRNVLLPAREFSTVRQQHLVPNAVFQRPPSADQVAALRSTVVTTNGLRVDQGGPLRPVYHGGASGTGKIDLGGAGAHFGSLGLASRVAAASGVAVDAYVLNLLNPLRCPPFKNWSFPEVLRHISMSHVVTLEVADKLWDAWRASENAGWEGLRGELQAAGYDGLVYEGDDGDNFVAFDRGQIISAESLLHATSAQQVHAVARSPGLSM